MYTKEQLQRMVIDAARRYGIDERIALAQIQRESGFNPNARGAAGEIGIAQFMPSTAAAYGLSPQDLFDPVKALDAWGRHMRDLLARYNGDYAKALAAYNAGPKRVDRNQIPASTRQYVAAILSAAGVDTPNPTQADQSLMWLAAIAIGALILSRV